MPASFRVLINVDRDWRPTPTPLSGEITRALRTQHWRHATDADSIDRFAAYEGLVSVACSDSAIERIAYAYPHQVIEWVVRRSLVADGKGEPVSIALDDFVEHASPVQCLEEGVTVTMFERPPSRTASERAYLDLMMRVLHEGSERPDRTGVGTRQLFGATLVLDLRKGLPLLTTKRVFFRGVVEELLFFLRGSTDTSELEKRGVNIWTGNTSREALDNRGLQHLPVGDMGKGYGYQWRSWSGRRDQIAELVQRIRRDPLSRRHIVSAWNVDELDEMALPPCHCMFQISVDPRARTMDLAMYQRSCDVFLGLPFNMASYSILLHLLCATIGDGYKPGFVHMNLGDCHIYRNHERQVRQQLGRIPFEAPRLHVINPRTRLEDYVASDLALEGYEHHEAIRADMAV